MENPRAIFDRIALQEITKMPMIPAGQLAVGDGESLEPQDSTEFPKTNQWKDVRLADNSKDISKTDTSFSGELVSPEDFESDNEFYLGGEQEIYVI